MEDPDLIGHIKRKTYFILRRSFKLLKPPFLLSVQDRLALRTLTVVFLDGLFGWGYQTNADIYEDL